MAKKKSKKTKGKKSKGNDTKEDHGVMDVSAALEAAHEAGEYSQTKATSFDNPPDGSYSFRIDKSEVKLSKKGNLQIAWELTIAAGDCMNRKVFKYDGLDTDKKIGMVKANLAKLGIEAPDDIRELPEVLEELVGTFCKAKCKTNGDFFNTYFEKALDDDEVELDEAEEYEEEQEEIEDEEEEEGFEKGDRVTVEIDDTEYSGTVKKVKGEVATVLFDDGDTDEISFDELTLSTGDDSEDEEEDDSEEIDEDDDDSEDDSEDIDEDDDEDDSEDEEALVEISFKKFDAKQKKVINKLATKHEFDEEDYDNELQLAGDIAEYLEMSGKYSKPADFIKAIKKADKSASKD